MDPRDFDWPWQPEDQIPPAGDQELNAAGQTARLAARCFRGEDGAALLTYLKALTMDRALGPDVSDATLRHLEGQRQLIRHLCTLIDLGRSGPDSTPTSKGDIA